MDQPSAGSFELSVDGSHSSEVFLSALALPAGAQAGDVIAIRPTAEHINAINAKSIKMVKFPAKPILYAVDRPSEAAQAEGARVGRVRNKSNIIINPAIAANFDWLAGMTKSAQVTVELFQSPAPAELTASHVELYFSNMYLGRSDMFRLSLGLNKTALNLGQRISLPGASSTNRIRVGGLFSIENKPLKSAYIDSETKVVFRSESARTFVFVEVSQEMWHFEEDGSMLLSKCELFLSELIGKWKGTGPNGRIVEGKKRKPPTSHTVSVILYGRVIYDDESTAAEERAPLQMLEDGTLYRDFYKVVVDADISPSLSIVRRVAAEMREWQKNVLLRKRPSGEQQLAGRLAFAHESPVLEATNLALNVNEEHWVDRDLHRTGFYLAVITAGTSFYHVPKDLLRLTTERMLCHGIGLDLISLSKTPLHTVPLFSFRSREPGLAEPARPQDKRTMNGLELGLGLSPSSHSNATVSTISGSFSTRVSSASLRHDAMREKPLLPSDQRDPLYFDPSPNSTQPYEIYYAEPLFVFCSFFGSQVDKPYRIDRFMPRARCYELFSQGVGERMAVAIPLLAQEEQSEKEEEGLNYLNEIEKKQARRNRYDAAAIGVKVDLAEHGIWPRQSGATSGASIGSDGRRRGSTTSEDDDAGIPISGKPRRAQLNERRAASAASGAVAEERERGRRERKLDEERKASSTVSRSRTPVGRPRDVSVAASTRTISSNWSRDGPLSKAKSAATPALIARLAQPGPAAPANSATTSSRPSWLSMFGSKTPGASTAPAPSVSVSRVDAVGHQPASHDIEDEVSVTSDQRSLLDRSPASSTSRRPSLAPPPPRSFAALPTQPISIGTRVPKIRDLDQQRPPTKLVSSSPSIAAIGPVVDHHRLDRKRQGGPSRFNPSKPGKRSLGLADQARRWASIFIRHTNDQRAVNWISITRGACLPLTTDYLPTPEVINTQYTDKSYSVSVKSTPSSFFIRENKTAVVELVAELISQRVSFGFQVCLPDDSPVTVSTLAEILEGLEENAITGAVYLSLANQVHCISYDRRTQQVDVRVSLLSKSWKQLDYDYGPLIWTSDTPNFQQAALTLAYPSILAPEDWETQDNLIAGVRQPDAKTSARHWRTRLVLLPDTQVDDRAEILERDKAFEGRTNFSDEEIRHQGFMVLLESIENLRWTKPDQPKEPMPITYTTKSAPEWALEAAQELPPALRTDVSVPPTPATQPRSLFQRVISPHHKLDELASPVLRAGTPSPTREDLNGHGRGSPASTQDSHKPTVLMTHAVVLDLDPSDKSDRAERVVCHLDRSHNVQAAYHIELTWLTSSGRMIDLVLKEWTRIGAKYGLKLVEVSTRGVASKHNPFQRAWPVQLAVAPPEIEEDDHLPEHHYQDALLRSLDFFLDLGAESTFPREITAEYSYRRAKVTRSQYIHRSGTMLLSVLEKGDVPDVEHGFAYVPNQNYILKTDLKADLIPYFDELVKELRALCKDEERLRTFWSAEQERVKSRRGSPVARSEAE